MRRRDFLRSVGLTAGAVMASWRTRGLSAPSRPNILFITTDDMNCDSVGVFDCGVPDTTPNIDGLARQGVRFTYAHVQVANCVPSRNVMQTGRYPHSSGVEGFYKVKPDFPILPDVLKENGYFIGIKDKVSHSTPYHPYPWDLVMQRSAEKGAARSPKSFHEFVRQGIARSREARKPFYLVANITDPHKPFYGEARSKQSGFDNFPPSKTYDVDTIPVPGFLPDLPEVRLEVKRYYDSVRRADDCVGAALRALRESGEADSTVVMFLSDHGMPFPFAKTNVYHHSTRTPWIVRWPRMVRAGTVDDQHMISAIDFMPTILDITGIAPPEGLQGRSFAPILKGRKQSGRDHIIKEYNENAGGGRHPMRAVETRRFCYIFNPWSNGERVFRTATQGTTTYKLMQTLAETDTKVAARLEHFDHRTLEEFYDVENDRDSLHNLIDDPRHARDIDRLRGTLEAWMVKTGDPCLEVFRRRDDLAFREAFMRQQQDASNERRKKARPKQPRPGRRRGLIAVTPPEGIQRGRTTLVIINHTLPPRLGKQLLHVMLKDQDGRRIQRRVLTIRGEGNAAVEFDVPSRDTLTQIVVAAFVGKDFQSCLQHIVSRPVPVR